MMMVALVVLGIVSYQRLAIDEYPDITYPVVVVQTTYRGASPQVMEREVSRPIEEALNTVQGVYEITSTSGEGSSLVRVQLNLNVNVMEAQQDVMSKVAAVRRELPQDIEDPIIRRFDPNDRPIISIAMQSAERPIRELTDLADEVMKTRIEAVAGVGEVNVVGGTARQVQIQLDPTAMRAYGIAPAQVSQALQRENQEVPAGRVERGETQRMNRVTGRIKEPNGFGDIVVAERQGVPVRVRDIGNVVDGSEIPRSAAFMNSARAVTLDVLKISGANTVEVAENIKHTLAEMEKDLPEDISLTVIRDDSKRIHEALLDVQITIILGALLTIMIIYLFLNSWRSTIITGLTLPVSIISAFFIMWLFGFTINTMTLMALSLAIGLLIDDAIVVRENIVRHLEMGKDHFKAAKEGTDEIGLAVISTTLAVVAVFIPVAFMGGMIGRIFFQFGVTVAFAVLVSLFVSFTLDPMLSSVWYDPEIESGGRDAAHKDLHEQMEGGRSEVGGMSSPTSHLPPRTSRRMNPIRRFALAFNEGFDRLGDRYPGWLAKALSRRAAVLAGAGASIVIAILLVPKLGFTWMPDVDSGEFNVSFRVPPGSRIEYTMEKGREIASFLKRQPEVEFTYLTAGAGFRGTPNNGQIYVRLKPRDEREKSMGELQNRLRGKLRQIPGVQPQISGQSSIFGGRGQPIRINVQG